MSFSTNTAIHIFLSLKVNANQTIPKNANLLWKMSYLTQHLELTHMLPILAQGKPSISQHAASLACTRGEQLAAQSVTAINGIDLARFYLRQTKR